MAYVSLLTSTECAFWPVPLRNYYLMPPKIGRGLAHFGLIEQDSVRGFLCELEES
jgi:hypothetical protein